jgi:plastocyanin
MRLQRLICGVLVCSLAACGGGGGSSQLPTTAANSQTNAGGSGKSPVSSGKSWSVQAGDERQKNALSALAFGPDTITIDEGDSITWTVEGNDHTITFLGSNAAPPGDPTVPQGGNTFNGTNFVSSGILPAGSTYTLTFTKAGTYPYFCALHDPEMNGVVVVQPAGTPYPRTQGYYLGVGTSELNAVLSDAMTAVREIPFAVGGPTVAAGAAPGGPGAPPSQATVLRFLDGDRLNLTTVTIPLGGVVTWVNYSNNEPHTVTFPAAGQPLSTLDDVNPFGPATGTVVNGQPIYNGTEITNSGVFGTVLDLPTNTYSLKFTVRGTFTYECLIHDEFGMIGTVIVK